MLPAKPTKVGRPRIKRYLSRSRLSSTLRALAVLVSAIAALVLALKSKGL